MNVAFSHARAGGQPRGIVRPAVSSNSAAPRTVASQGCGLYCESIRVRIQLAIPLQHVFLTLCNNTPSSHAAHSNTLHLTVLESLFSRSSNYHMKRFSLYWSSTAATKRLRAWSSKGRRLRCDLNITSRATGHSLRACKSRDRDDQTVGAVVIANRSQYSLGQSGGRTY